MQLVTVKYARTPEHDPANKVTGPCPANPKVTCTDVTGQHHTVVATDAEVEQFRRNGVHITRIEGGRSMSWALWKKVSQRRKSLVAVLCWVAVVVVLVAAAVLLTPWLTSTPAHAQGLLPPGYRSDELVAPDLRGESWCVGPGQRLMVMRNGVSGTSPFAVVIDQRLYGSTPGRLAEDGC